MNATKILAALMFAYITGSTGPIRAGSKAVNVTLTGGAPVHLSLGAALLAAEKVIAGDDGTFTSGTVSVTISNWVSPA